MPFPVHILSTRKLSQHSIEALHNAYVNLHAINFINTIPIHDASLITLLNALASEELHVIFTSPNAVMAVAAILQQQPVWKVYCTAGTTATLVTQSFANVTIVTTGNNGAALAKNILAQKIAPSHMVFFCGNKRMPTMPKMLADNGFQLQEIMVYITQLAPRIIANHYDGILFFSPSAVESFFTKNKVRPQTTLFSIGPTTTTALQKFSDNIVECLFPDEKTMIENVCAFARTQKIIKR